MPFVVVDVIVLVIAIVTTSVLVFKRRHSLSHGGSEEAYPIAWRFGASG
jgi:hypothetical protein